MKVNITIGWDKNGSYRESKSFTLTDVESSMKPPELIEKICMMPIPLMMKIHQEHLYLIDYNSGEKIDNTLTFSDQNLKGPHIFRLMSSVK